MIASLTHLFLRDLDKLKTEIEAYTNDSDFWSIQRNISNSGGNLAIHIIGNLNHFVGAVLGNTGYSRDREGEFKNKNISRSYILEEIDALKEIIEETLLHLSSVDLQETYPINIRKEGMTVAQFLIHLYGHLNYHLGQLNYHRRFIDNC